MQSENKNDGVQFSDRYWAYSIAKEHLRGTSRPEVFPIGGTNPKTLKELSQGLSQGYRTYDTDGVSTTLAGEAGGIGAKTGLYAMDMSRRQSKIRKDGRASTLDANYYKGLANQERPAVAMYDNYNSKIRRLTPVECARLQGFPDDWHEGVSDTQAYKAYGNAVTTSVITAIGERLVLK